MGPLNKKVVVENGCSKGWQRHRQGGCCFVDLMWCSLTPRVPLCACVWRHRSTMKDGIANNSTASISQARKAVEQLKMEACMDRIKVRGSHVLPVSVSRCWCFYFTQCAVCGTQNSWTLCVSPFHASFVSWKKIYIFHSSDDWIICCHNS